MKKLGQILKRARVESGLDESELAAKIRLINPADLPRYEERVGSLPSDAFFELVIALGVNPLEIMEILCPLQVPASEAHSFFAANTPRNESQPLKLDLLFRPEPRRS